jgi:hypothetical protein
MRSAIVAPLLAALIVPMTAVPASAKPAKDKLVRLRVGPFRVEAQRDREICQAIRVPQVAGMELASYEVRSLFSPDGKVGSHHLVIYGYSGDGADQFPRAKNPGDVVDAAGCNGFGPVDLFKRRVQLAGSGGEFRKGKWASTRGQTPLGLATTLPRTATAGDDAYVVVNSHYFNNGTKAAKGLVKVVFRMRPYDGTRTIVRNWTPLDASLDINVPPGNVGTSSSTFQLDGAADDTAEGGFRPDHDVCILLMTTHTHKRGTKVTIAYEQDGMDPVTLLDPTTYDYEHPSLLTFPFSGTMPQGNLLKAYTAENGFPRLRYTCHYDNGGAGYETRMGCEERTGVTPGIPWRDAVAAGSEYGNARPCGQDAVNCQGFGTGRCVASNLVFGPLSDDDMCVIPVQFYDPKPGVPADQACNPY